MDWNKVAIRACVNCKHMNGPPIGPAPYGSRKCEKYGKPCYEAKSTSCGLTGSNGFEPIVPLE